jgi:hypothetical protein
MFQHRPVGPALPAEQAWSETARLLDEAPACHSAFVEAVTAGTAPLDSVRRFAVDLAVISRELPLIEGEIASRAALHGVDTVILLSHGATLAFGYQSHKPLVDLVARFAHAVGTDPTADEPTLGTTVYLVCTRSLGLEWFEAGIAATLVDSQWTDAAPRIAEGLRTHYNLGGDDLACFEALAAFSGPRATEVPKLIREITTSAYHQRVVAQAVRESITVWSNMWSGWSPRVASVRL